MMYRNLFATLAFVATMGFAGQAAALTTPYTEDFSDGVSGWTTGTNPTNYFTTGGADGGAYLSTTASLTAGSTAQSSVAILFRCESIACSDGAFQGDWRGGNIVLSWYIRHDADIALEAYARLVRAPNNSPAASALISTSIAPNTWTRIDLEIDPTNAAFDNFGGGTYESVFANIGRIQLGLQLPTGFSDSSVKVDLDSVHIAAVPEPETYALFAAGLALLSIASRRQRRS